MKTKTINIYKFDELSDEAKYKARIQHIQFLEETFHHLFDEDGDLKPEYENYFVVKAQREMERMGTPWFFAETIYHDYQKELDEEIKCNDYDFYGNGELFT